MADVDSMTQLGGWDGYRVVGWQRESRGSTTWVVIELSPRVGIGRLCSGCSGVVDAVHDSTWRRIRDLPVFGEPVELLVPRLRLACPHCGPRMEACMVGSHSEWRKAWRGCAR